MTTCAEVIAHAEAAEQQRKAAKEKSGELKYKRFYASKAWKAARWKWMASQPKPLRCAACGASSKDTRLAIDHIVSLKNGGWDRRLDATNLQALCSVDCNWLGKGRDDATDFRTSTEAATCA